MGKTKRMVKKVPTKIFFYLETYFDVVMLRAGNVQSDFWNKKGTMFRAINDYRKMFLDVISSTTSS